MQNMHISPNKTLRVVGRKSLGWDEASKNAHYQFIVRNITRIHAQEHGCWVLQQSEKNKVFNSTKNSWNFYQKINQAEKSLRSKKIHMNSRSALKK